MSKQFVENSNKMRIAFVAQPDDSMYPPVQGGSLAIWIYQMARMCAKRGQHTVIFANHGDVLGARAETKDDIDYIYTPTGLKRLINKVSKLASVTLSGITRKQLTLPRFASSWQDIGYAYEVGRRSKQLKCDIVHIMNYSQFVPVIRKLNPQSKICLHMQCEWLTQLDAAVMEKRIAQADLIMGCSEYITRKIVNRFPQFKKRCITVPNAAAITPECDRAAKEPYSVLFVGRVSPEKGVHDLIRAFHDVLKRFPEARLHIAGGVGSAPYEILVGLSDEPHVSDLSVFYGKKNNNGADPYGEILEKDAGAELGKRILFEGKILHSQIEDYYARAAVLVNPSLSESFGMTLVEAMMHKTPVVATSVGGMTFIVDHGQSGLLVKPADPKALAAAISEILGDQEKAHRMGDAGRKKAIEMFSWDATCDLLLEHFRRIVG